MNKPKPCAIAKVLAADQGARDDHSPSGQRSDDSHRSSGDVQIRDDSQEVSGRTREVKDEGVSRVLSLGVDSAGGYAVPYQLSGKKGRPRK